MLVIMNSYTGNIIGEFECRYPSIGEMNDIRYYVCEEFGINYSIIYSTTSMV